MIEVAADSIFRWVSITPFGLPLEPEVYIRPARSISIQDDAGRTVRLLLIISLKDNSLGLVPGPPTVEALSSSVTMMSLRFREFDTTSEALLNSRFAVIQDTLQLPGLDPWVHNHENTPRFQYPEEGDD